MTTLTTTELTTFESLEAIIWKGMGSFIETGKALMEIRDSRLYRETYATFEDYCRVKWDMSKTNCNRLIASIEVTESLTPVGVIPSNERQIRPLTKLDDPEQQRRAWEKACTDAKNENRCVVAKDVTRAVKYVESNVIGTKAPPTEPESPPQKRQVNCKPAIGLQYANMAIVQLNKIPHNDVERKHAFARVIDWIGEHK
jgi:hypothetical protein